MRFKVEDESMYPTLRQGDYLIVNKLASKFFAGDIVVFKHEDKFLVKRIEKISNEKYFVVGDNKKLSQDSRKFGAIKVGLLVGKVLFHFKS